MRALLVDKVYDIVSDQYQTQEFLKFVAKHKFTELTFYTGGPVETRVIPLKEPELNSLINQVKTFGVTRVQIAVGSKGEMDRVNRFIGTYQAKVDGFWVESEWWNNQPRDFNNAVSLIQYMRGLAGNKTIGTYIGWPYQEEMAALIGLVDYVYIHAYVPSGLKTYSRVKGRLDMIKTAAPSKKVVVYPIFSAEWSPTDICNQGPSHPSFYNETCFMGPWLKSNNGPIGADAAFSQAEIADRTTAISWRNHASIRGFYYYSYTNLKNALM